MFFFFSFSSSFFLLHLILLLLLLLLHIVLLILLQSVPRLVGPAAGARYWIFRLCLCRRVAGSSSDWLPGPGRRVVVILGPAALPVCRQGKRMAPHCRVVPTATTGLQNGSYSLPRLSVVCHAARPRRTIRHVLVCHEPRRDFVAGHFDYRGGVGVLRVLVAVSKHQWQ